MTTVDRNRASDSIAQVKASLWLMNSVIAALRYDRDAGTSPLRGQSVTFFPGTIGRVLELRRRRVHAKLAAAPGVRRIRRPVTPQGRDEFDLYYVRSGPRSGRPVVIIPGGPGMASIAAYRGLRNRAAAAGIEVIMVEHRGVGMSRRCDSGGDLPGEALTITGVVDDVAAVLDDAGVEQATVYGASYGSYLAAGVGIRHPGRVSAMVLDSPLLGSADLEYVRRNVRELLWDDDGDLADKVHRLVESATLTPTDLTIAAAIYGVGGSELLGRHFDLLLARRRAMWTAIRGIAIYGGRRTTPFHNEPDLVGAIGFRELNFAGTPDGLPLDPALTWREVPGFDIPFEGEPFDLVAEMPRFGWPTAIVSGGRDLVTPPVVADRIAELVPNAALVRLPTAGHSMLDTRERAALRVMADVAGQRAVALPASGAELDALPAGRTAVLMGVALTAAARIGAVLPRST
ncbi:MAG: alpha/beta fold hydrolase [Mycobacteriaceae bacterium]